MFSRFSPSPYTIEHTKKSCSPMSFLYRTAVLWLCCVESFFPADSNVVTPLTAMPNRKKQQGHSRCAQRVEKKALVEQQTLQSHNASVQALHGCRARHSFGISLVSLTLTVIFIIAGVLNADEELGLGLNGWSLVGLEFVGLVLSSATLMWSAAQAGKRLGREAFVQNVVGSPLWEGRSV